MSKKYLWIASGKGVYYVSLETFVNQQDNTNLEITAPPMSEGITEYQGAIAVLYESGSDKYRNTAKNPQDRIEILKIEIP